VSVDAADLVVRGGRVYTVDERAPWAEAVAVRGERIVAVGRDEEIADLTGPSTELVDAARGLVLPGFIDSHNHVRLGTPDSIDLSGAGSLGEIHSILAAHLVAHPEETWVEAGRWNYHALPGSRMPTKDDLPDEVTGGRPAFLISYDAHTAWMNRRALERFGIGRGVERVAFGEVELDPATREPTGFVRGFAVMGLSRAGLAQLSSVLPGLAPDRQYGRLVRALDMATGYGITTVVEPQNSLDDLALFERARAEGTLSSRLVAALFHPGGTSRDELDAFDEARRAHDDDRFRVGPIKLYIDDVIEPHTAALLDDYADRPGERGSTFWDHDEFGGLVTELDARGFQTFTHAIGDLGVRTALDAIERAQAENGPRDARHQLVHVELVHPDDLPRFVELGVVACMQPRHAGPDIADAWRQAVGTERVSRPLPWRSLRDAGAALAFASDWDVAEMDPLVGIYSAIARADLEGKDAWAPEETVDIETAVRGYTTGGAYANFAEGDRGTIEAGKYADLAVLDRDLFTLRDPLEILDARVGATIVGGAVVFRAS
jgi:predicted amidohydrolase YtcJ